MLDRPNLKLLCVKPEMVTGLWPVVRRMIDDAFAASDMVMPADLLQQLCEGKRLLWVVADPEGLNIVAAGMTCIYTMRSGTKMCKILESAGDGAGLVQSVGVIEAYAKGEGCDRVMIEGRVGWQRTFPDYKTVGVILEKRL